MRGWLPLFHRLSLTRSRVVLFLGLAILIWISCALGFTVSSLSALRRGDLHKATRSARLSHSFVQPLSLLTLRQIPDLEVWRLSLQLLSTAEFPLTQARSYLTLSLQADPQARLIAEDVVALLPRLEATSNQLLTKLERSFFAKTLIKRRWHLNENQFNHRLESIKTLQTDTFQALNHYLQGEHSFIILLQNTHELRATGGFPGSYARLTLNQGVITELKIQDIYEPDGQFTGFVPAPPGVAEYLSSGQGLRLPDANWDADFPTSAQRILTYFALGDKHSLDGVMAINLSLAERLLGITGEVYLPDYQLTVTPDNLADVARADRENFFPGSQQKPQFLQALINQVKFKLESASPAQQQAIAQLFWRAVSAKDIQLYLSDPTMQAVVEKHRLGGQLLFVTPGSLYLQQLESNVGINKANRGVTRTASLELDDHHLKLTTTWQNNNHTASALQPLVLSDPTGTQLQPPAHLHYVNYHRILISPEATVTSIIYQNGSTPNIDSARITQWDEQIITTSSGSKLAF
jgi:hypothetical protein